MSNKSPAFQWYPKDILASARVQMMSLSEECAYRRLLDFCWINGSVPADAARAARLVGKGCTVEVVKIALEMFETDPNDETKLIHDRLEVERIKQESNSKVRQAAAEARWNKQGTSADARGKQVKSKTDANAMQTDMQNDALHTSSSTSSVSKETGDKSPPVQNPIERRIWTDGVELLAKDGMDSKTARTFLGSMAKTYGTDLLAESIAVTQAKNPAEIKTFLIGTLNARKNNFGRKTETLPTPDEMEKQREKIRNASKNGNHAPVRT